MVEETVGVDHLSAGFGYCTVATGIAIVIAGPINGWYLT